MIPEGPGKNLLSSSKQKEEKKNDGKHCAPMGPPKGAPATMYLPRSMSSHCIWKNSRLLRNTYKSVSSLKSSQKQRTVRTGNNDHKVCSMTPWSFEKEHAGVGSDTAPTGFGSDRTAGLFFKKINKLTELAYLKTDDDE
jgi:hypothetical protein